MKIGDKVTAKPRFLKELRAQVPRAAQALKKKGYFTVSNRWKLGCGEPYWLAFKEVRDVAFPEDEFRLFGKE